MPADPSVTDSESFLKEIMTNCVIFGYLKMFLKCSISTLSKSFPGFQWFLMVSGFLETRKPGNPETGHYRR